MSLNEIIELWTVDCVVDETNIKHEALNIARLHNKYYIMLMREKLRLQTKENEFSSFKEDAYDYFVVRNPTKEVCDKWEWEYRRQDLAWSTTAFNDRIKGDKNYQTFIIVLSAQREKIGYLEAILKNIINRSHHINNYLTAKKFEQGEK